MGSTTNATATIGLFSGRPNPELSLNAHLGQLASLVKTTIGAEPIHPPPPPRLGHYYGFFVRLPAELASSHQLPEEFDVYSAVLTERRGRDQKHWRDVGKVEDFLIDRAYEEGHGDLLKRLGVARRNALPIP
jgi:hypothetical protein